MHWDTRTEGLLLDVDVFRLRYTADYHFWIYSFGSIVRF